MKSEEKCVESGETAEREKICNYLEGGRAVTAEEGQAFFLHQLISAFKQLFVVYSPLQASQELGRAKGC